MTDVPDKARVVCMAWGEHSVPSTKLTCDNCGKEIAVSNETKDKYPAHAEFWCAECAMPEFKDGDLVMLPEAVKEAWDALGYPAGRQRHKYPWEKP